MKEITLSLTSKGNHKLKLPLGQGSLSIGTLGMNKKNFDVLVDESESINWEAFNECYTGHGEQNKDQYPYGDWPRFFYYYGNDMGFADWTIKRETEDFTWVPQKSLSANLSKSNIRNLHIHSDGHQLDIDFGKGVISEYQKLFLSGDLDKINFTQCRKLYSLGLGIPKDASTIPAFPNLTNIESLNVGANVKEKPFNCKSLLQFKDIKHLSLSGNMIGLEYLSEFENLERLSFRQMPKLENVPSLKNWSKLTSFIAVDIDEIKGKELRKELRLLKKERDMDYSTVSGLRSEVWFTTEYGIPFTSWDKNGKKAISKYKKTVKLLKKTKNIDEIKDIIIDFTKFFNQFENIETIEREDVGEAIFQLIQVSTIEIDKKRANEWFDSSRDY